MKKPKKYAAGKRVISSENFPMVPMEDDVITRGLPMSRRDEILRGIPNQAMMDTIATDAEGPKPRSSFGKAFNKAREEQGPDGVFMFDGKKYSTRVKSENQKIRKPTKKKKKMGGTVKYSNGGKVRGRGAAKQGVRAAKMISMKGS
jgi:hypothetical protein